MKTPPTLAAAVIALVAGPFALSSANAGHRDSPAELAHVLESEAWTTVSMFDEDIRHDRRRQNSTERAFHDHLIELKHDLHEIGEALDRHNHHSVERTLNSARHTLNCAIDMKHSVHMHRETEEAFHRLVGGFSELDSRISPDRGHQGHHHSSAPEPRHENRFENRRPVPAQTRPTRYDSRDSNPRQVIVRSLLSHLANR